MSDDQGASKPQPRTFAEKVSLAVALLILALVVGAVVALWITDSNSPPSFTIERGLMRAEGDQFYLPVTLANTGDTTASQVTLEGTLTVDGAEETATTTFDFVPGHSEVAGALVFSSDPGSAEVRVVSYQEP